MKVKTVAWECPYSCCGCGEAKDGAALVRRADVVSFLNEMAAGSDSDEAYALRSAANALEDDDE